MRKKENSSKKEKKEKREIGVPTHVIIHC